MEKTSQVHIRIQPKEKQIMKAVARLQKTDLSKFVRQSVAKNVQQLTTKHKGQKK